MKRLEMANANTILALRSLVVVLVFWVAPISYGISWDSLRSLQSIQAKLEAVGGKDLRPEETLAQLQRIALEASDDEELAFQADLLIGLSEINETKCDSSDDIREIQIRYYKLSLLGIGNVLNYWKHYGAEQWWICMSKLEKEIRDAIGPLWEDEEALELRDRFAAAVTLARFTHHLEKQDYLSNAAARMMLKRMPQVRAMALEKFRAAYLVFPRRICEDILAKLSTFAAAYRQLDELPLNNELVHKPDPEILRWMAAEDGCNDLTHNPEEVESVYRVLVQSRPNLFCSFFRCFDP